MQVRLLITGALVAAAVALAAWAGSFSHAPTAWTRSQAESITSVRGMPIHPLRCDGIGQPVNPGRHARYRLFACTAGARASFQTYDTVGVTYVLRPLSPFAGAASRYALADVTFAALSVP